jgi:hypothetical protein
MQAIGAIAGFITLALFLVLLARITNALVLVLLGRTLWGKSSPEARLAAARLFANGLIGVMAGPLATLAAWLFLAVITGSKFKLRSPDAIGNVIIAGVLLTMTFWGGLTGVLVSARGRGVRVVTLWNFVRVFLGGFAGVFLGALASPLGLVTIPLAMVGLYVGMSASTTRPPDSDEPTWWPKPPAGWSPGNGTGASHADPHGDAEQR